ncbi:UNVERIFIED_CONTAM: hypothetical protein K2H54_015949 [Gekko kuhli]
MHSLSSKELQQMAEHVMVILGGYDEHQTITAMTIFTEDRARQTVLKDLALCGLAPLLLHLHDESPSIVEACQKTLPRAAILLGHRKRVWLVLSRDKWSTCLVIASLPAWPLQILLPPVGSARSFVQITGGEGSMKSPLHLVLGACFFGPVSEGEQEFGVFPKPRTDV